MDSVFFNCIILIIGGAPTLPSGLPAAYYLGFKGCIHKVKISRKPLDLLNRLGNNRSPVQFCHDNDVWHVGSPTQTTFLPTQREDMALFISQRRQSKKSQVWQKFTVTKWIITHPDDSEKYLIRLVLCCRFYIKRKHCEYVYKIICVEWKNARLKTNLVCMSMYVYRNIEWCHIKQKLNHC